MNYKRIQEAATESRIASAETLTHFGLQTSIDDAVALTGIELSYDEVAESAFAKGAEWLMTQPLLDRLSDDEIKKIKAIVTEKHTSSTVDTRPMLIQKRAEIIGNIHDNPELLKS